jgi:serine/threonine protein kinase
MILLILFLNVCQASKYNKEIGDVIKAKYYDINLIAGPENADVKTKFYVFKGKDNKNQNQVVIKKVPTTKMENKEAEIHQKLSDLNHENIIKFEGFFKEESDSYLVTEFAHGGDLLDYIKKYGPLEENKARKFFKQILDAVSFMHNKDVIHRDIKPDNIVITEKKLTGHDDEIPILKIIDFDFACYNKPGLLNNAGTQYYKAPESFTSDAKKLDVYSMGVLLHVLVYANWNLKCSNEVSYELNHLIKNMTKNSEKRFSADQIRNHAWMIEKKMSFYTKCTEWFSEMRNIFD